MVVCIINGNVRCDVRTIEIKFNIPNTYNIIVFHLDFIKSLKIIIRKQT